MSIRVLAVDDEQLVRTGLRMILSAVGDIDVVGEARDGQEAVDRATTLHPDVVLMDIRMPGMDGLEATRRIRERADAPRVVILTTFDLDEHVFEALRVGASGFLLKDTPGEMLVAAIRAAVAGEALLAPSVTRRLIEAYVARPEPLATPPGFGDLTEREREVLTLLARGRSNAEIATELVIGEATVKTHVARVLDKLGVRDRVQAVIAAYESGLVARPG
jgi:DNA-binding NarL/FixJ family response regulator